MHVFFVWVHLGLYIHTHIYIYIYYYIYILAGCWCLNLENPPGAWLLGFLSSTRKDRASKASLSMINGQGCNNFEQLKMIKPHSPIFLWVPLVSLRRPISTFCQGLWTLFWLRGVLMYHPKGGVWHICAMPELGLSRANPSEPVSFHGTVAVGHI